MIWFNIEEAIRFFIAHYPTEKQKKPSMFHSIRVCSELYLQGYSEDICIAWLLHDAIEDTSLTKDDLANKYWNWISEAVSANSKDNTIPKELLLQDIVNRCANHSEWALIVKSADVLDNYKYYSRCKIDWKEVDWEIRRCNNISKMIIETLPIWYNDIIFDKIRELVV